MLGTMEQLDVYFYNIKDLIRKQENRIKRLENKVKKLKGTQKCQN